MDFRNALLNTMQVLLHWLIIYVGYRWGKAILMALRKDKTTLITRKEEFTSYLLCVGVSLVVAVLLGILKVFGISRSIIDKNYALTVFLIFAVSTLFGVYGTAVTIRNKQGKTKHF